MVRIYINNNNRTRLKTSLKRNKILDNNYKAIGFIEFIISVSEKPDYIKFIINIMLENNNKATMVSVFKDSIFAFTYNVRKIMLGKFSDPGYLDISNF